MIYRNLQDAAISVIKGKFIAIHASLMKPEISQIRGANFTPKNQKKKKTVKPKVSGRKEIIKIRVEVNEIKIRKNTRDQYN